VKWKKLRNRFSSNRQLADRLKDLEAGLDLPIGPVEESTEKAPGVSKKVKLLREKLVEWFPLPPAIRASRRRDWLTKIARSDQWGSAAKHVAEFYPHFAELDPSLITFLSENEERKRQGRVGRNTLRKAATNTRISISGSNSTRKLKWVGVIVAGIILFVVAVRALTRDRTLPAPPRDPYPTKLDSPNRYFNPDGSPKTPKRNSPP
jgi:hypothetical protein